MIRVTHRIDFNFRDREATDLEKLNRLLARLKLKDVSLDTRGYLATMRDAEDNLLHRRYGLDSGTLICTPGEEGLCFQIDTLVASCSVDQDETLEIWRNSHPDEVIRKVFQYVCSDIEDVFGYLVLYHHRI